MMTCSAIHPPNGPRRPGSMPALGTTLPQAGLPCASTGSAHSPARNEHPTLPVCTLRGLVFLTGLLALAGCGPKLPSGVAGPPADALAREVQQAVGLEGWKRTGAVSWNFGGRNQHLWDRERDLIRVRWGDMEVLRYLWEDRGIVYEDGQEVTDPEDKQEAMDAAYAAWVNDAFWLYPFEKFFDAGVTRQVISTDAGKEALLITFNEGGLTPGDSYLWLLEEGGRPYAWKMWVSIIPIKGAQASWQGWQTLPTGALIATVHDTAVFTLKLTEVAGAATLGELTGGEDPFAALVRAEP